MADYPVSLQIATNMLYEKMLCDPHDKFVYKYNYDSLRSSWFEWFRSYGTSSSSVLRLSTSKKCTFTLSWAPKFSISSTIKRILIRCTPLALHKAWISSKNLEKWI